jgi:hypothetical protein
MSETAVLLCRHGSRDPEAITEFETFATALRPHLPDVDLATITSSSRGRRSMSERVDEFESGEPTMNCQFCIYRTRTRIIGYKEDAGAPQVAHHDHVRGIGGGTHAPLHDHVHHAYPAYPLPSSTPPAGEN